MEKQLTNNNERLLDLIERKSFEQLSDQERMFVLSELTEGEYRLQRAVVTESAMLSDEVQPSPLILPSSGQKGVMIPLYQAVIGVAAAVLISFFLFRSESVTVQTEQHPVIAQADTVYIEKRVTDTVIQYKTDFVERPVITSQLRANGAVSNPEKGSGLDVLPLNQFDLENRGCSAADDEQLGFIPSINGLN